MFGLLSIVMFLFSLGLTLMSTVNAFTYGGAWLWVAPLGGFAAGVWLATLVISRKV